MKKAGQKRKIKAKTSADVQQEDTPQNDTAVVAPQQEATNEDNESSGEFQSTYS